MALRSGMERTFTPSDAPSQLQFCGGHVERDVHVAALEKGETVGTLGYDEQLHGLKVRLPTRPGRIGLQDHLGATLPTVHHVPAIAGEVLRQPS